MKTAFCKAIFISLLGVVGVSACGNDRSPAKRLDENKVERFLAQDASGRLGVPIDVSCPAKIVIRKGDRFECTATTADGEPIPMLAKQKDTKGNVTWHMDARSTKAIETEIQTGVFKQKQLKIAVNCPDAIEFDKGSNFNCVATRRNGQRSIVVVTQVDDKGSITWSA